MKKISEMSEEELAQLADEIEEAQFEDMVACIKEELEAVE